MKLTYNKKQLREKTYHIKLCILPSPFTKFCAYKIKKLKIYTFFKSPLRFITSGATNPGVPHLGNRYSDTSLKVPNPKSIITASYLKFLFGEDLSEDSFCISLPLVLLEVTTYSLVLILLLKLLDAVGILRIRIFSGFKSLCNIYLVRNYTNPNRIYFIITLISVSFRPSLS